MKRLIIAAAVLVTTTGMSVWAQAPAAADADKVPQQAAPAQRPMPMTNCPGASGAMGDAQKGCPMAPNDMKSEQDVTGMHQMMRGMMQGSMRNGDENQSGQGR